VAHAPVAPRISVVAVPVEDVSADHAATEASKSLKPTTPAQLEQQLERIRQQVAVEQNSRARLSLVQEELRLKTELAMAQQSASSQHPQHSSAGHQHQEGNNQDGSKSPHSIRRDANRQKMDVKMMMGFSWKEKSTGMDPLNSGNPLHRMTNSQEGDLPGQKRFEFANAITKQVSDAHRHHAVHRHEHKGKGWHHSDYEEKADASGYSPAELKQMRSDPLTAGFSFIQRLGGRDDELEHGGYHFGVHRHSDESNKGRNHHGRSSSPTARARHGRSPLSRGEGGEQEDAGAASKAHHHKSRRSPSPTARARHGRSPLSRGEGGEQEDAGAARQVPEQRQQGGCRGRRGGGRRSGNQSTPPPLIVPDKPVSPHSAAC